MFNAGFDVYVTPVEYSVSTIALSYFCIAYCPACCCCGGILYVDAAIVVDGIVVVCTDLSGKELHRQVGVGILVTSGKPM